MSIRTLATLAVAILFGLVAVIILNNTLGASRKTQSAAAGGLSPVVVAAQPIARGMTLHPGFLKVVGFPAASVPAGAFTSVDQLSGGKGVQRLALRGLTPGEPVLLTEVSGPGGRLNLSSVIDPGMQAVAIRASDVTGVGGFVLPGDRVDVLLTRAISQGNNQPVNTVTQVLADNVKVVGVDQSDNDEADKPAVAKAVTIQVTPEQAQAITLGQAVGSVSLSLRHVADEAPLARRATTVAELGFKASAGGPSPGAGGPSAHGAAARPLSGPGIIRVTRVTETTGYRLGGR